MKLTVSANTGTREKLEILKKIIANSSKDFKGNPRIFQKLQSFIFTAQFFGLTIVSVVKDLTYES